MGLFKRCSDWSIVQHYFYTTRRILTEMSLEATLWAWDLDIQPVTKLVLLAIADYCGSEQTAWPSYETISKRTGLDRRTIIRHCKALEEAGHISINKRKIEKTKNCSNLYQLHVSEQYLNRKRVSVSQSQGRGTQSVNSDSLPLGSDSLPLSGRGTESPKPTNIEPNKEPNIKPIKNVDKKDFELEIPKYFDIELWEEYLKNRKALKCKNTPRALKSLINKIQKIEDVKQGAGMEALEEANSRGWKSVVNPFEQKPFMNNKGFKQQAPIAESRKIRKF